MDSVGKKSPLRKKGRTKKGRGTAALGGDIIYFIESRNLRRGRNLEKASINGYEPALPHKKGGKSLCGNTGSADGGSKTESFCDSSEGNGNHTKTSPETAAKSENKVIPTKYPAQKKESEGNQIAEQKTTG